MIRQRIQDFLINLDDYKIGDKIGQSNFGDVYHAIETKTGKNVVIKFIRNIYSLSMKKEQKEILRGMVKLFNSNIPGIVPIYGFRFPQGYNILPHNLEDHSKSGIVIMKFMKNGCLEPFIKDYLSSKGKNNVVLNPTVRSKIIFGVASTMKKIHKIGIIHKSLHLGNVFLDENMEARIADFSLKMLVPDPIQYNNLFNYPFIMPPETHESDSPIYEPSCDVYAFAFLLYMMFCLKVNFASTSAVNDNMLAYKLSIGQRPVRHKSIPEKYWGLITCCWSPNPSDRPTFDQITEMLKNDEFAIEEFGMKTDLDELHEYQSRIEYGDLSIPFMFEQSMKRAVEQNE